MSQLDSALIGHFLVTYNVEGFHQCSISCASNPKCKGVNYEYSPVNSSFRRCELSDATHSERHPQFYVFRKGFSYYEMVTDSQSQVFYRIWYMK